MLTLVLVLSLALPAFAAEAEGGVLTRGKFVARLFALDGAEDAQPAQSAFADVPADGALARAVGWAEENGLITGISPELFARNAPLTREAMAVLLLRMGAADGRRESGMHASDFADADRVSPWAAEAVEQCVSAGLLRGVSETELEPGGTLTRASLAVLLARLSP